MKLFFLIAVAVLIVAANSPVFAEPWQLSADANFMLSQNSYSNSWTGGEAGSAIWISNLNSLAAKQLNPKVNDKTTLKLAFGQTLSQNEATRDWSRPAKSTDLVDLESLLQLTLGGFVNPFISGRMESQFLDASDALKIRHLNPIVFTEGLGAAKVFVKNDKRDWNARLAFALRQKMNRDFLAPTPADSLNRESKTTADGGLMFIHEYRSPILGEKINFTSRLTVLKALFYSESSKLSGPTMDYWKAVDMNFENIFAANITKSIMVNLYVQMIYDKEIDLRLRTKETLAVGVTYKLK